MFMESFYTSVEMCDFVFVYCVFSVCEVCVSSHCVIVLSVRAVFSRPFCHAVCVARPFLLISAPYFIYQVNSILFLPYKHHQFVHSFCWNFCAFRKPFLNACYMPDTTAGGVGNKSTSTFIIENFT